MKKINIAVKIFIFFLITIFLESCTGGPSSGKYKISGQIINYSNQTVYILDFYGFDNSKVDSVKTDSKGFFSFDFDENNHVGLYRFVMANNHWNFIYNKEDIEIKTHFFALADSMKVIKSEENKILSDYIKFLKQNDKKSNDLYSQLRAYKRDNNQYFILERELQNQQMIVPYNYVKELSERNPEKYISRLLKTQQMPLYDPKMSEIEIRKHLAEHIFDNVDFNDSALIRSQVFVEKFESYFSIIGYSKSFEESEQEYIKGLNRIMSLAAVNDQVFNFLLEYISDKFEKSEFEDFFAYLTENYLLGSSCKNEEESRELEERLEFYKKLAVGNIAPDFEITLENSTRLKLSEMENPHKLLVFWASWCGHCKQVLPALKNLYHEYKPGGFEILAISLDSVKQLWEEVIKMEKFDWINYSELKGWDGSISKMYGLWATPVFYLLDRNNKIILKPRTLEQLRRKLSQL